MPARTPLASRRREIPAETSGAISGEDGRSVAGRSLASRSRADRVSLCCWLAVPARVLAGRVRILVTMAFSAVPAPLYVLYAARDGFGPLMVTWSSPAYAVGVIGQPVPGRAPVRLAGRRPMAVLAVARSTWRPG